MGSLWTWSAKLETGVSEIDRQHKELLNRGNKLAEELKLGKRNEAVLATLKFLEVYIVEHFEAEEDLQKKCGYPEHIRHKTLHDTFIREFEALRDRIAGEGVDAAAALEISSVLNEWLVEHIGAADREFADFYKNRR